VDVPTYHRCVMTLCSLCIDGAGGECHSPGCALWINRAPDLSLRDNPMVDTIDGVPLDYDTLKREAKPASPPPPAEPRAVEAAEDAPLLIGDLADYWDARRKAQGKPDASTCAAELRRALADSRNTWLKLEALAKPAMYLNDRVDTSAEAYRAKVEALCAAIDAGAPEGEIDDARDALLAEHPEPDHD
jgi:hypothetical protein